MIDEVVKIYLNIILEFLLELYVFYVLAMFRFSRSRMFWLKLFSGLVVLAGIAFGAAVFY